MRIILAIDGSEQSEAAAEAVFSQQWPRGSVVRLLTVVHGIYGDGGAAEGETPTFWSLVHEVNEDALRLNMRSATVLRDAGVAVEMAIAQGEPGIAIVEDARSWSADLVVLGPHGRTAARHAGLGSVAQHVLLNAPCLVDIIPGEGRHREDSDGKGRRETKLPDRAAGPRAFTQGVRRYPQIRRGATPDRLH